MEYDRTGVDEPSETTTATHDEIYCVDVFGERYIHIYSLFLISPNLDARKLRFPFVPGQSLVMTMVRNGYMPTSPLHPERGIKFRVLELYDTLSSRCGRLGIEPFVRALCELQNVSPPLNRCPIHWSLIINTGHIFPGVSEGLQPRIRCIFGNSAQNQRKN